MATDHTAKNNRIKSVLDEIQAIHDTLPRGKHPLWDGLVAGELERLDDAGHHALGLVRVDLEERGRRHLERVAQQLFPVVLLAGN